MSSGMIIALLIVALSILLLVVVGVLSYNEMKPTFRQLNELNAVIHQKMNFYTREGEQLNKRVALLNQDVEAMQQDIQEKNVHFQDFVHEQGEFQSSVQYLKNHAEEYSQGIARNIKDEVKEDGPKIMKSFKLAFKKTAQKQKARFKNK